MDTPSQLEKEYEFGPILGEGTFGVVYRGIRRKDNAKCAIKKILREKTYSTSERARLDREISILRLVRHRGIIELLAVAESPSILFIITELCEGNTLADSVERLPEKNVLEEYIVIEIVRQVASALSYLHNRGIIHRDLKAGNIMLLRKVSLDSRRIEVIEKTSKPDDSHAEDACSPAKTQPLVPNAHETRIEKPEQRKTTSANRNLYRPKYTKPGSKPLSQNPPITPRPDDSTVQQSPIMAKVTQKVSRHLPSKPSPKLPPPELHIKLIDFGLAIEVRKIEDQLGNACGTPLYMAPEVVAGRSYTRQCDVWSLGIMMYQLLSKRFPFTAQTEERLLEQISHFDTKAAIASIQFISALAQNCLTHVLDTDPAYRYSASELLLDPWVAQFGPAGQEDTPTDVTDLRSTTVDGYFDMSGRVSSTLPDSSLHRLGNSISSRPPSVGNSHMGSTHSATNVLELMKQYHKELTGQKQDDIDKSEKG